MPGKRTDHLPRCGALLKDGVSTCTRAAGADTGHLGEGTCSSHLGGSEQKELRYAVDRARREVRSQLSDGTPIDPHAGILKVIALANEEVDYWTRRIAQLEERDYTQPETHSRPLKLEKGAEHRTERVEERGPTQLHIAFRARREAQRDLVQFSKEALKAGVAERQMKINEQQAQLVNTAIRGILTDLGIANHPQAPAVVRRHLSLVANTIDTTATTVPATLGSR